MQFNSYIFILAFLPLFVIAYFLINRINVTIGKMLLIIGSAVFYVYGGWKIALILGISIIMNYVLALCLGKIQIKRRVILTVAIVGNILLLFYFKYINFLIDNLNKIMKTEITFQNLILPLGISFFTFQQIMYLVNIYDKKIEKVNLIDYLGYILYFPKLLSGPIMEPVDLITQINDQERKKVNWDNICNGLKIFSLGLFKKILIADTFALAVNWGYENMEIATSIDWLLIMLFYTFEIYFDFSGYSDMATGVSIMLNIELPMNFDSPYKAVSIRDFWKRWHITLTGFLTRYVYIPLGGSRKGEKRTYLNTLIVFLVSGIWHGANWTFILWGILHGCFSVFDRIADKIQQKIFKPVRWVCTFTVVNILWLLFRSDSVAQWWTVLRKIFSFDSVQISDGLINTFTLPETPAINRILHLGYLYDNVRGFNLWCFTLITFFICIIPGNNYRNLKKNNWFYMIICAAAFVWAFLCLSGESVFVYFNF